MSVPENPGPAGWYADPQGSPGALRWWDGDTWTDLAMAPPGGASRASGAVDGADIAAGAATLTLTRRQVGDAAESPSGSALDPDAGGLDGPDGALLTGRTRRRFAILLGALGAVALLLVGLVATGAFDAPADKEPGADHSLAALAPPSPPDPQDALVRIVDPDAGISYAYLGEGWKEWDNLGYTQDEMSTVHGQYIVTQELIPDGGQFIAQVTSGPLADWFGAVSVETFPTVIADAADSVRGKYYPQPNESKAVKEGPLEIDGHQAYQTRFDLSWDVEGYDSTGERVCLLLIDTGKPRPALMYISIPNTHGEMYGIVDDVIASIRVDA